MGSCEVKLSEMRRSLITSLQGKPPAIHSQSLLSDLSDGMNIDLLHAKYPALEIVALFRVDLILVTLLEWFDTLVLVLLSDVADFVSCLVFGPVFLVCESFGFGVFLEPTWKSEIGNVGKEILSLIERSEDELDFEIAMSDFLMIFPLDNSSVDFDVFIIFWLRCL